MAKIYSLTPEHRAQLKPWADKWIANALRTEPQTDSDRESMRVAMRGLYEAARLDAPPREVFAAGPISGAIAAGIAARVWWLRENPQRHAACFGRVLSEADLMSAIPLAVALVMRTAVPVSRGEPAPKIATRAATSAATRAATSDATSDATSAATDAATNDATSAATYDATSAATSAATRDATYDATSAATYDATSAATDAATRAATYAATSAATRDATYDATRAATSAATRDATDAATDAATSAATRDATYDATRDATRAATRAATSDATSDATSAATYDATRAATSAATRDATDAATYDATDAATSAATYDATRAAASAATRDATHDLIALFLARGASDFWAMRNAGNQWSGWVAYLSFFRHVAKLDLPIYDKFQHYESATIHGGPRFMHRKFWIVSDFPTTVQRDEQNRPHCTTGPFTAWRDGFALHQVHGVRVPARIIEHPESITIEQIDAEPNAEIRRVMIELYDGPKKGGRYMADAGAKLVHEDSRGQLYRRDIPGDEAKMAVRVVNSTPEPDGTRNVYWLPVPPTMRTASEAVAWTFGLSEEEYQPIAES
jgi:hypothetical protein